MGAQEACELLPQAAPPASASAREAAVSWSPTPASCRASSWLGVQLQAASCLLADLARCHCFAAVIGPCCFSVSLWEEECRPLASLLLSLSLSELNKSSVWVSPAESVSLDLTVTGQHNLVRFSDMLSKDGVCSHGLADSSLSKGLFQLWGREGGTTREVGGRELTRKLNLSPQALSVTPVCLWHLFSSSVTESRCHSDSHSAT